MKVYLAEKENHKGEIYQWVRSVLTNESKILLKEKFARAYVERVNG